MNLNLLLVAIIISVSTNFLNINVYNRVCINRGLL